jgi:hypothetical protein
MLSALRDWTGRCGRTAGRLYRRASERDGRRAEGGCAVAGRIGVNTIGWDAAPVPARPLSDL